jgi:hypothetical protein
MRMFTIVLCCLTVSSIAQSCLAQNAVTIESIEDVQSIQSTQNDVPLVAGKATVVRVYLSSTAPLAVKLSGKLAITPNGSVSQTLQSVNSVLTSIAPIDLSTIRRDLTASLNFVIPLQLTNVGLANLQLASLTQVSDGSEVSCMNCSTLSVPMSFAAVAPLRLIVIGLSYFDSSQNVVAPSQDQYEALLSWIQRAYPVSSISATFRPLQAQDQGLSVPFTCNGVNAFLLQLRGEDHPDPRAHYIAIVSAAAFNDPVWQGTGGMRGCGVVPSEADPSAVATSPVFPGGDDTGTYVGHELAHTLGRKHPGFCPDQEGVHEDPVYYPRGVLTDILANQNGDPLDKNGVIVPIGGQYVPKPPIEYNGLDVGVGTDLSAMKVLPGISWTDVMTYCPNEWMSKNTYVGLMTRINQENTLFPPQSSGRPLPRVFGTFDASKPSYIHVIASVDLTHRSAQIKYAAPVPIVIGKPPVSASQVLVRTVGKNGQILGEYPVELRLDSDISTESVRRGLIDCAIPNPGQVDRIEVILREPTETESRVVLGSTAKSDEGALKFKNRGFFQGLGGAFSHQIDMAPSHSKMTKEEKDLELKWDTVVAGVKAESSTTYTVQFSTDSGKTWNTIAMNLKDVNYQFNPEVFHLSRGTSITLRIIADRGFNASAMATRKFIVP